MQKIRFERLEITAKATDARALAGANITAPQHDTEGDQGAKRHQSGEGPGPWDSPKLVNRKILPNELNILLVVLKVSFRKDNDFRDNILDCC